MRAAVGAGFEEVGVRAEEEIDALVEEGAGGDAVDGDVEGPEGLAGWSELGEGVVGGEFDGSDERDMGLELGPAKVGSESGHEVGASDGDVFWWNRPHRIHGLACHNRNWIESNWVEIDWDLDLGLLDLDLQVVLTIRKQFSASTAIYMYKKSQLLKK